MILQIALVPVFLCGQQTQHFYNLDSETTVTGKIEQVIMEPRYKNSSPFLVIILKQDESQIPFTVEVSPVWFFERDFHKGEPLEVIGSLHKTNNINYLIAREIRTMGESIVLRDKHGIPNWRGGQQKGKRKGKWR